MSTLSNANELDECVRVTTIAEAFDPGLYFERWLQEISGQKPTVSEITDSAEAEDSQFYLGSFPGSNCEVTLMAFCTLTATQCGNINSATRVPWC